MPEIFFLDSEKILVFESGSATAPFFRRHMVSCGVGCESSHQHRSRGSVALRRSAHWASVQGTEQRHEGFAPRERPRRRSSARWTTRRTRCWCSGGPGRRLVCCIGTGETKCDGWVSETGFALFFACKGHLRSWCRPYKTHRLKQKKLSIYGFAAGNSKKDMFSILNPFLKKAPFTQLILLWTFLRVSYNSGHTEFHGVPDHSV